MSISFSFAFFLFSTFGYLVLLLMPDNNSLCQKMVMILKCYQARSLGHLLASLTAIFLEYCAILCELLLFFFVRWFILMVLARSFRVTSSHNFTMPPQPHLIQNIHSYSHSLAILSSFSVLFYFLHYFSTSALLLLFTFSFLSCQFMRAQSKYYVCMT